MLISLKCSRGLRSETVYIDFPQCVHISNREISKRKDIFVNRLTFR